MAVESGMLKARALVAVYEHERQAREQAEALRQTRLVNVEKRSSELAGLLVAVLERDLAVALPPEAVRVEASCTTDTGMYMWRAVVVVDDIAFMAAAEEEGFDRAAVTMGPARLCWSVVPAVEWPEPHAEHWLWQYAGYHEKNGGRTRELGFDLLVIGRALQRVQQGR